VILLGASEVLTVLLGPTWAEAASAARILCAVGLLRALSFVMPPLLDAMGFPSLTLVYTVIAATVLPVMFVIFAAVFGGSMSYLSVSLAWATGYPVAFAVLLFLVLTKLGLSGLTFVRRISGIIVCAGAAIMAGMAARVATASASDLVRLVVVIGATLGTLFVLLAYLQGISPRAVAKALRGR
jgi:O-antigen/teichoic acid export membrane protein